MFSALTYFFDHSIYFARLHHVNPLCKHKYAFLQMKEAPNQKFQEKKPLLKFKNTKKYMCLERIWRKKCFRACRHRPLMLVNANNTLRRINELVVKPTQCIATQQSCQGPQTITASCSLPRGSKQCRSDCFFSLILSTSRPMNKNEIER